MPRMTSLLFLTTILATLGLLAGCGGGGGGGSSSNSQPIYLTGQVENAENVGTGGDTIADSAAGVSTTSASNGDFTLNLPASTSGTTVVIDYYNSGKQIVLVQSYSLTATSGQTVNVGVVALGPPGPPVDPGQITK